VTTRAKRSRAFRGGAAGNAHPVASRRHAGPDPARDAERSRLLIVTGAAAADVAEVPPLVRTLIAAATEIVVVAPVLPGRLQWLASDVDRVRLEADERLRVVIDQVESVAGDALAGGSVGDETPYSAFVDAVRRFRPHHILIALRAADHSAWQERRLVDRVRQAFHLPLTIFEIDASGRVPTVDG
jgi:hypothetical protein